MAPDSLICAQANGIIIGAFKTAAADLMAQVSDSESDFDLKRNLLFFAFGGAYAFQGAVQHAIDATAKPNVPGQHLQAHLHGDGKIHLRNPYRRSSRTRKV